MDQKKTTEPRLGETKNDTSPASEPQPTGKIGLTADSDARRKPHGKAKRESHCGDEVEFYIQIREWVVTEVAFDAYGCNNTIACARIAQLAARGKPLRDALAASTAEKIAAELGLGEAQFHAAELVADALAEAIRSGIEVAKDPWKRSYSR